VWALFAEANKMLKQYSHKVGINFWHIEFGTKYRYKMLGKDKQNNLIIACLKKVCKIHNIKIHVLEAMSDHVHMIYIAAQHYWIKSYAIN